MQRYAIINTCGREDCCARERDPFGGYCLAVDVDARIAELEKALRDVSIVDLGFGVPKYFCAACVSYGDGPESIRHKDNCVTAQALALMVRESQ